MTVINDSSKVTLHFALALEDGSEVDSTFTGEPATFAMGDGSLLPGFESKLHGLQAGDNKTFLLPPADAFGEVNPDSIHDIDRHQFKGVAGGGEKLAEGLVVSFEGAGKRPMPGVVEKVAENTVTVNFNHPLAGRSIHFKVEIVAVENP